jgi:hypothetical protein
MSLLTDTRPATPRAPEAAPLARAVPQERADPWAALWLLVIGVVMEAAIWWGFVQPYQLRTYYKALTPFPLDLAKINGSTLDSANMWALTWIVLFAAVYLAYRRAPARPTRVYWVVLGLLALVFCGTLLFMFPVGAADLFDQIFRGRILGHYGANPFFATPDSFADDPLRPWVGSWANTASPYGPAWEVPAAAMSLLAGDDLWANLLAFKGLVIGAYIVAALCLWGTLRRLRPDWAARGLLLFAWNPLILFETAGNGHNDMVMIAWMLAAMYLLARGGRWALFAPAALMGAALVKFVPGLLMLPLLAVLWYDAGPLPTTIRRRLGRVSIGAVLAGGLAVAAYAPFWHGTGTIGALARGSLFTASIPKVVVDFLAEQIISTNRGLSLLLATQQAEGWVRSAAAGLAVGWVLVQTLRIIWAAQDAPDRLTLLTVGYRAMYEILFVTLLFATLWFQPWYLQWLIALAPLTFSAGIIGRTLLFTLGGLANYFVWDFLWLWNRATFRSIQITAAAVITLPALLYTLYLWLRPRAVFSKEP